MSIAQRQRLPKCCLVCGQGTDRSEALTFGSGSDAGANIALSLGGILLLLLSGIGFIKTGGGDKHQMTLHIPVCPCCSGHARLAPRHLDFQNYQARFLAHRRFEEALQQQGRA